MAYETVLYEAKGRVAIVTMNRPDRLNAWTPQMGREKAAAFETANADPDIGAIVLTGAGRGFCAGADMRDTLDAESRRRDQNGQIDRSDEPDWVMLVRRSKPVVAAVNGAAIGMGCTMTLCCDTIIASSAAKFSLRFVRLGVVPELGSTKLLLARVGFGRASELCLSGRTFEAEEAGAINMVEDVVPPERLMGRALEVAGSFAENPTLALLRTKQLIDANISEPSLETVHARETKVFEECAASPEHKAAIASFLARA